MKICVLKRNQIGYYIVYPQETDFGSQMILFFSMKFQQNTGVVVKQNAAEFASLETEVETRLMFSANCR